MKAQVDRLVQRLAGSRTPFYLAAFVFLLLTTGGAMVNSDCVIGSCGDSPADTKDDSVKKAKLGISAGVYTGVPSRLAPLYHIIISGQTSGPPYPRTVTVTWTPPPGATNFRWYDSPERRDGPPLQFVWPDVSVDPSNGWIGTLQAFYDHPEGDKMVNTVTVESGGEQATSGVRGSSIAGGEPLTEGVLQAQGRQDQPDELPAASPDTYYTWWIGQSTQVQGVALTTELCQQWADFAQQGTAFMALRFPVYPPTSVYTEPYTLPVVFRGTYSPTLWLEMWVEKIGYRRVLTVPLEYKPGYFTFLENELPAAPGEHWLALGTITTPTVTCPQGLNCPDGQWRLEAELHLDFGGEFDTFTDRVLPYYYCYEGQRPPLPLTALQGALGAEMTSYQGWSITCVGPHYLTLRYGLGDWSLSGQGGRWITPTQTISFAHRIYNTTFPLPRRPLTFTLEVSSTLDAGWTFYADAQGQTPLTNPIRVDSTILDFWVFGQAPADAAPGPYTLFVTARTEDAPPASQQVTDLMWVGDWVAPSGPPLWYRLYLPLLLRP